jgi:hypothetical protein
MAENRLDAKEAVRKAKEYSLDLLGEEGSLEEIELSDDQLEWIITLGYLRVKKPAPLISLSEYNLLKEYKKFTITAIGKFVSMKLRE